MAGFGLGPLVAAMKLGAIPAVFMFIFSLVGLRVSPSKRLAGALQHFAAGILLSAVAQELVPPMVAAEGFEENLAVCISFMAGVAAMIMLGKVFPEQQGLSHSFLGSGAGACAVFPRALLAAVVIDGCMDGMLLGIESAANEAAGLVLAISLAIEMSFLGLTLAASMKGQPMSKSVPAVFAASASIVVAAAVGGFFAGLLAEAKACRTGLMSFGAAALIYMVAEELLLEAHEDDGAHVWWVDGMLYVGFLASIYLDKILPEGEPALDILPGGILV